MPYIVTSECIQCGACSAGCENNAITEGETQSHIDITVCIECGTCNRYCEMGIDIRLRARQGIPMRDTECVACGACIAVCPRYALSFYPYPGAAEATSAQNHRRFRRRYARQLATPRER